MVFGPVFPISPPNREEPSIHRLVKHWTIFVVLALGSITSTKHMRRYQKIKSGTELAMDGCYHCQIQDGVNISQIHNLVLYKADI